MRIKTVILGFLALVLMACGSEEKQQVEKMETLDLNKYEVPVSIQAPEGAKVSPNPASTEGLEISNGTNFFVLLEQIKPEDSEDEVELDLAKVKEEALEYQKSGGYLSKVLVNDKNGFVYEIKDEEIGQTFGFFYTIKIEKERVDFRASQQKKFTQEEVMKMYEAVKSMNPMKS
jgi:hypothetical protein